MKNGKKNVSEKIFLKISKDLQKTPKNAQSVFKIAILNSSPVIFLKQIKRRRKQTTEFPFLLKPKLRISYGVKILISSCKINKNNNFSKNFKTEVLNSASKIGQSFIRRNEIHKNSFLKKKFSNYRWF